DPFQFAGRSLGAWRGSCHRTGNHPALTSHLHRVADQEELAAVDSARSATPAATKPIPSISAGSGSWCSTITPMIVALAGSNDMSSAKAARASLAIATSRVTY